MVVGVRRTFNIGEIDLERPRRAKFRFWVQWYKGFIIDKLNKNSARYAMAFSAPDGNFRSTITINHSWEIILNLTEQPVNIDKYETVVEKTVATIQRDYEKILTNRVRLIESLAFWYLIVRPPFRIEL